MTTFSFLIPFAPARPEQALPYAALAQWSRAHRLWQGQAAVSEPHQTFVHAAASGFRVPVGTGVTLMPFRHPYEAALQAQSLAVATGHPVVAGYGPGSVGLQRSVLGAPYASPLQASREYATIMRGLLAGESVTHDGTYFSCRSSLTPIPCPPVETGLGVLRPGMARLAGEVADIAITWLTPASYIRDVVRPALREGAAGAGRAVPRLAAIVPVALSGSEREPERLALASNANHMRLPHYVDMLRRSGIEVDMERDPVASAKALIAGRAFLTGTPETLATELTAFAEAGVDEIVLNVTGVCAQHGSRVALADLETLLREAAS